MCARVADQADEQLVVRGGLRAVEAHDRLREHFDAAGFESLTQTVCHKHVVVATDDALIGVLVNLDPPAAAILRGLAGGFRGSERVAETTVVRGNQRYTERN